jgi:hypothetical protein
MAWGSITDPVPTFICALYSNEARVYSEKHVHTGLKKLMVEITGLVKQ